MTDTISRNIWMAGPDGGTIHVMDDDEYAAVCAEKAANADADGKEETVGMAQNLLNSSDWTQLSDTGITDACKAAFVTYRASLRAIRKNPTVDPTWPTKPTEEWT